MNLKDLFGKPVNEPLNAEFGSIRLIGSWFNKGFVVGRYSRMTEAKSFEGVLLSGNTGSGKTSRYLLKQALSLTNASLILNDPQGELWQYSSGYLNTKMDAVYSINFSDASKSAGFNPFSRIKKQNDINKLAHLLIASTLEKGSGDVFWSLSSTNLTAVLIRILLHQPKEYHNLANLIQLTKLFALQQTVDELVAKSGDEELILDYKAILAIPSKTLDNITASVKSALQPFDDPEIKKTTAFDTVNFEELRTKRIAVFLNNTIGDQKYISILNSIFFEQFYAFALERITQKHENSVFMILDEAGTLKIPMLAQATATTRKARVGTFLAVQAHSQLTSFYKDEAATIKANCRTHITLTGQTSLEELRQIETLSGKRIYKDEKNVERTLPLIAVDAIRMMPENRSLILSGHYPLIMAKSSPYFRSWIYRRRAAIPPAPFTKHIPDEPIPLIK